MTPEKTHKQNFATHPIPGQSHKLYDVYVLGWFKKTLLYNPWEMIRVRIFSEMIRISAQKSEL